MGRCSLDNLGPVEFSQNLSASYSLISVTSLPAQPCLLVLYSFPLGWPDSSGHYSLNLPCSCALASPTSQLEKAPFPPLAPITVGTEVTYQTRVGEGLVKPRGFGPLQLL